MISTVYDLHDWAYDLYAGNLLSSATQRQRLDFSPIPVAIPGVHAGYGLGVFIDNGWIGHNGSLPGYQTLAVYLPRLKATVVVLTNTDASYRARTTADLIGEAITGIISPGNRFIL